MRPGGSVSGVREVSGTVFPAGFKLAELIERRFGEVIPFDICLTSCSSDGVLHSVEALESSEWLSVMEEADVEMDDASWLLSVDRGRRRFANFFIDPEIRDPRELTGDAVSLDTMVNGMSKGL